MSCLLTKRLYTIHSHFAIPYFLVCICFFNKIFPLSVTDIFVVIEKSCINAELKPFILNIFVITIRKNVNRLLTYSEILFFIQFTFLTENKSPSFIIFYIIPMFCPLFRPNCNCFLHIQSALPYPLSVCRVFRTACF